MIRKQKLVVITNGQQKDNTLSHLIHAIYVEKKTIKTQKVEKTTWTRTVECVKIRV